MRSPYHVTKILSNKMIIETHVFGLGLEVYVDQVVHNEGGKPTQILYLCSRQPLSPLSNASFQVLPRFVEVEVSFGFLPARPVDWALKNPGN